jgi:hypothetical protein
MNSDLINDRVAWSVKEWQQAVGCSRNIVYQLITAGKLRTQRIEKNYILILTPPNEYEKIIGEEAVTIKAPGPPDGRVSWSVTEWRQAVGISSPQAHRLVARNLIRSRLLGRKRLILTPPSEYMLKLRDGIYIGPDEWSVRDWAKAVSCTPVTVYRLINTGKIESKLTGVDNYKRVVLTPPHVYVQNLSGSTGPDEQAPDPTNVRVAWSVKDWAYAVSITRTTVHRLISTNIIRSRLMGKKRLILTPPDEYVEELKKTHGATD